MGLFSPTRPVSLLLLFYVFHLSESASDYTTLIYKGCSKQPLSDPTGAYSQAISSLFGSFIAQSSKTLFSKATAGSGGAVSGLFQCRGDLSSVDCYNCVSTLPTLIDKLCGGQPAAARVQLAGCYLLYEVAGAGAGEASGMDMLFKTCSGKNIAGSGFEEKRDTAFSELENGMASSNGFYTTSYESVFALGQCEGDLGAADCGDCVRSAVQRCQVECGTSVSGQVYLDKCFVSYGYGSNGVPKKSASASASASDSSIPSSSGGGGGGSGGSESGQNTGKTVAIILGGAVLVAFLVICLMVAKSAMKKRDDL
ncbi:Superoxide dismutase [Bertholletia excelsa]